MIDRKKLDLARQWAADIDADRQALSQDTIDAAADLISSLPDQWVDAEKVREVINKVLASTVRGTVGRQVALDYASLIDELLPAPPLPTLADMTPEEREACRWMRVEVYGVPCELGVIIYLTEYHATVMWHDGTTTLRDHKELTPLPNLPRLEWPRTYDATPTTETPPAETVDNTSSGTSADPEPQPGEAWLVNYKGAHYEALYWYSPIYAHWALALNREGLTTIESHEATPMHRLVPEVQA